MARGSQTIKKNMVDPGLSEMFNTMLNTDGDPEIVRQKNERIRLLIKTVATLLMEFATGALSQDFSEYRAWFESIRVFAERTRAVLDIDDYKSVKNCVQIKQVVMMCKHLIPYKRYIGDKTTLTDRWIHEHPDSGFVIFDFTNLDLKQLFQNHKFRDVHRKYVLTVFNMLYTKSHDIYEVLTSPDMDVSRFKNIILNSIDSIKSIPELNRCKEAFGKITDSIQLLETNFDDYFKDMTTSGNASTLIESFIIDVSKNQTMSPTLMGQFRKIIAYYKSHTQTKVNDPRVKALFDSLNKKMGIFDDNPHDRANAGSAPPDMGDASDEDTEVADVEVGLPGTRR